MRVRAGVRVRVRLNDCSVDAPAGERARAKVRGRI